ncbi:MAG: ABC transporter permease subunit [Gammaproteobacteria bacterium]|nr:ABC transporter permease subunit [Gammaproteobacteria bacterium]
MNECLQTIQDYGLRSLGFGERLLPKTDITLCEQVTLIGSGLVWNIYFTFFAVLFGFAAATLIAVAKASPSGLLSKPASWFVFVFRGSPLFIQFFFAYELFVMLPKVGVSFELFGIEFGAQTQWLTKAWLGGVIVLFLNTTAYSAEIFYGALKVVPKGDIEAAKAYGMNKVQTFRRVVWPTMLRLSWPSYTNEVIFLFHASALVYFSSFPTWQQSGDAMYYASYFAKTTFNPFIAYPIAGGYFIMGTLCIVFLFGLANKRLNSHLALEAKSTFRFAPQWLR